MKHGWMVRWKLGQWEKFTVSVDFLISAILEYCGMLTTAFVCRSVLYYFENISKNLLREYIGVFGSIIRHC